MCEPGFRGRSTLREIDPRRTLLILKLPLGLATAHEAIMEFPYLHSWKEIAAYMGTSVRTVQRWESQQRLPVHRPKGSLKGGVLAVKSELECWIKSTPGRPELVRSDGEITPEQIRQIEIVLVDFHARHEKTYGFMPNCPHPTCDHVRRALTALRTSAREVIPDVDSRRTNEPLGAPAALCA